jgi:hypothetical protein
MTDMPALFAIVTAWTEKTHALQCRIVSVEVR